MIAPVVVLEPGDRVLVVLDRPDISPDQCRSLVEQLEARFPDTHFTVISAAQVVVAEPDNTQETQT